MSGPGRDGFFIGWSSQLPPGLGRFLAMVAGGLLGGLALAALALSASVDDPGGGDFDWPGGERSLRGVLTAAPYPLLHLAPSAAHPAGHAVMLAGLGKTGLEVDPALEGREVEATGLPLRRGTLDMLAKVSDAPSLRPVEGAAAAPPSPVPLGRWRITGEICDGKCRTGAMRPGSGIAHRACATYCIAGGLPAVLVATAPVEGSSFLLLAGPEGGPMPESLRPLVGLRIRLDGALERRGDMLVFRADPASAVLP